MSWLDNNDIIDKIQYNADNKTWQAFDDVCPIDMLPNAIPHYPLFIVTPRIYLENIGKPFWSRQIKQQKFLTHSRYLSTA